MLNLNDTFLEEIGLVNLSADEKKKTLSYVQEMLEMRVGTRLANSMSDDQLDEFEALTSNKQSNESLRRWLKTNFPNYEHVVEEELEKLKAEIKATAPHNPTRAGETDNKEMADKDLFQQIGLEKLADQEKLNISEDLGAVAMDRIATRLEAILTKEQAREFEALLHSDEAKAFTLLKKFVPNYPSIVEEEINLLRDDIVDTHAEVMKKLDI
jgi:hypothetical protein